jgi:hypothetical protein
MHIDFLLEEPSTAVFLANVLPQLLSPKHTFKTVPFGGKKNMLDNLPARLRAYSKGLASVRIVVLVDQHNQDCHELKRFLEKAARKAGLVSKSAAGTSGHFLILNRIVVKQLESWLLGDSQALRKAYPRVHIDPSRKKGLRDPDAISGDAAAALLRVLKDAGYHPRLSRLPKGGVAELISAHMRLEGNRSRSFQVFIDGLREMIR